MRPDMFWQAFLPQGDAPPSPWRTGYPAALPDGRVLLLPIRPLAGTESAIASLILNQTAFVVEDTLADVLAARLAPHEPEIVVGLPTLGLSLARAVAQRLGHSRYVPLGTSRKFWYDEALSVPLTSITSPDATKRLYVDPRMLSVIEGRRVALIDDVISSGRSMAAGLALLEHVGIRPVAIGAAMLQTKRWVGAVGQGAPVEGAIASPLLARVGDGWEVSARQD